MASNFVVVIVSNFQLKKLESFTFEEWRERYLEWTDSGKARISDLFRRIDKSGTGSVPRNAFIEEILRSSQFLFQIIKFVLFFNYQA